MRYKENETDAIAAVNTTFLKILDNTHSIKKEVEFDHWAKRIAINVLIDEYRKTKRRNRLQQSHDPMEMQHLSRQSQLNTADLDIGAETIIHLIQQLSEPGRTIFNLHALEGYTHEEVSEKLGMTPDNSRYYLHTARKTLRTQLRKYMKLSKPA